MKKRSDKAMLILKLFVSVLLFSVFIKLDSILGLVDYLVELGWPLWLIVSASVLTRMIFAGIVVLVILPDILGFRRFRNWITENLRVSPKIVVSGVFSFLIFAGLGTIISLSMGIFKLDFGAVFAKPNIQPDPDVIGWGYFLLALVPGIWEELAFRGLILSKSRQVFSTKASVLLSATFFGLFHFSNLLNQSPGQAIPGVFMAFCFGIGWGYLTVRSRSVVPAILSHYLVDSLGQMFFAVETSNPMLLTVYLLTLTLLFPVFNVILARVIYKEPRGERNDNEKSVGRRQTTYKI